MIMSKKPGRFFSVVLFFAFFSGANNSAAGEVVLPPAYEGMSRACPTGDTSCLVGYFGGITGELCVDTITAVSPQYWKDSRKQQPMPEYAKPGKRPGRLAVRQLLFMQDSASGLFSDSKHDVIGLAKDLQSGKVKASDLPRIEVWQDEEGRIWTINHRRVVSMIMAGLEEVAVKWADSGTVRRNRYELTTTNGGKKITVWLTDNVGMVVKNDGRCKTRRRGER